MAQITTVYANINDKIVDTVLSDNVLGYGSGWEESIRNEDSDNVYYKLLKVAEDCTIDEDSAVFYEQIPEGFAHVCRTPEGAATVWTKPLRHATWLYAYASEGFAECYSACSDPDGSNFWYHEVGTKGDNLIESIVDACQDDDLIDDLEMVDFGDIIIDPDLVIVTTLDEDGDREGIYYYFYKSDAESDFDTLYTTEEESLGAKDLI